MKVSLLNDAHLRIREFCPKISTIKYLLNKTLKFHYTQVGTTSSLDFVSTNDVYSVDLFLFNKEFIPIIILYLYPHQSPLYANGHLEIKKQWVLTFWWWETFSPVETPWDFICQKRPDSQMNSTVTLSVRTPEFGQRTSLISICK